MNRYQELNQLNYQATFLNRAAQEVLRTPDVVDHLMIVRHVAAENIDPTTNAHKLNYSTKMNEDYFSFSVEFLTKHGDTRRARVVLSGSLAERGVADGLKKGQQVRITGLFGQDQKGIKPLYATKYSKVVNEVAGTPGLEQV